MSNRGQNPNSQRNLKNTTAPDNPGAGKVMGLNVTKEQAEWLKSQEESASYHVRQALRLYIGLQKGSE